MKTNLLRELEQKHQKEPEQAIQSWNLHQTVQEQRPRMVQGLGPQTILHWERVLEHQRDCPNSQERVLQKLGQGRQMY